MLEVFKIAATLDVSGNGLDFMKSFALGITGAHGQLEALEKKLGITSATMKQAFIGFGEVFAGVELLKGIDKLADAGKELNHQQSMLMRNGVSYRDVMKETAGIYSEMLKQVPTASSVDFLRTLGELKTVKGTIDGAREALVQSLKIEGLIGNSTGKSAEGQGYDFWRTVEDKGIIQNKQQTDAMLNRMVQGTIATGGKIGGNDWFSYARAARSAWMGDDIEALPLQLMEMQTLTAPGAGSARRMFSRMIQGGQKLTNKQMGMFDSIGMLDNKGNVVDRDIEHTRPDLFIADLMKHLDEHGIRGKDAQEGWALRALNASSAGYFNVARAGMSEIDPESGLTRLQKERRNMGEAEPLDKAYATMMNTDYGANVKAFEEQWKSFMEAVGLPATKAVIPVLKELTTIITSMGNFADKHPQITQFGIDIAGVSGGILTLAGTLKLLKVGLQAINPFTGKPDRSDAKAGTIDDLTRGAEAARGSFGGEVEAAVSAAAKGGFTEGLKGGVIGGILYGAGAYAIDKLVPMIGGHSQEEHERLQKQGPEHFWSGLFGSAEAATAPSRGGSFGMRPADSLDRVRDRNAQIYGGADMNPRGSYYHPADYGDRMADRDKAVMDALEKLGDAGRKATQEFAALEPPMAQFAAGLSALAGMMGGVAGAGAGAGAGGAGGGFMKASLVSWDRGGGGGGGRLGGGSGGGPNPYTGGVGGGDFVAPVGDRLTAGMRQNNMGNLGWFRGMHVGNGLLGPSNARDVDHSIARYATQDAGIRAAAALAFRKYASGMHDTWDLIAGPRGWTPGALGPSASVNVARAMGLGNHDDLHLDNPDQMVKFLHGLAIQEHGVAGHFYTEDKIRRALGTFSPPRPAPAFTAPAPPPARSRAPGAITAQNVPPIEIHLHSYMDTKKVAHAVTKVQVAENRHHRSVGGMDGYGSHLPPGGDVVDSA